MQQKWAILRFPRQLGKQQIPRQMANSAVLRENSHAAEHCWPCRTVSLDYVCLSVCLSVCLQSAHWLLAYLLSTLHFKLTQFKLKTACGHHSVHQNWHWHCTLLAIKLARNIRVFWCIAHVYITASENAFQLSFLCLSLKSQSCSCSLCEGNMSSWWTFWCWTVPGLKHWH